MSAFPLQSLGQSALLQRNFAAAETFYARAVEVNEKFYGEGSDRVAESLLYLAVVPAMQKQYAKAETYMLRSLKIDESVFGADSEEVLFPLANLCVLYDHWEKPEKTESCQNRTLGILEKKYGSTSPVLLSTLAGEAKALRSLGRKDEAAQMEKRMESIRAVKPN